MQILSVATASNLMQTNSNNIKIYSNKIIFNIRLWKWPIIYVNILHKIANDKTGIRIFFLVLKKYMVEWKKRSVSFEWRHIIVDFFLISISELK